MKGFPLSPHRHGVDLVLFQPESTKGINGNTTPQYTPHC